MNNLKKIIVIAMCATMSLTLFACGEANQSGTQDDVYTIGSVAMAENISVESIEKEAKITLGLNQEVKRTDFDSLTSAMLALDSGKVNAVSLNESTAEYIAANNPKYQVSAAKIRTTYGLSMLLLDKNQDLCNELSTALSEMFNSGELKEINEKYINSESISNEAITFNKYEGAKTIKFAVTGDLPPIDYVSSDGTPTGYNIALIKALSDKLKINAEIVTIDSGSKVMALTSGKADVAFWTKTRLEDESLDYLKEKEIEHWGDKDIPLLDGSTIKASEFKYVNKDLKAPEGTVATISYRLTTTAYVTLK